MRNATRTAPVPAYLTAWPRDIRFGKFWRGATDDASHDRNKCMENVLSRKSNGRTAVAPIPVARPKFARSGSIQFVQVRE